MGILLISISARKWFCFLLQGIGFQIWIVFVIFLENVASHSSHIGMPLYETENVYSFVGDIYKFSGYKNEHFWRYLKAWSASVSLWLALKKSKKKNEWPTDTTVSISEAGHELIGQCFAASNEAFQSTTSSKHGEDPQLDGLTEERPGCGKLPQH